MFKVLTDYRANNRKFYKVGFYNKSEQWVNLKSFDDEGQAFELARSLNGQEPTAAHLLEMQRPIRKQFYFG